MTDKKAKLLWEDILDNGQGDEILNMLELKQKEVKVFLSYTKPEMFVSKETGQAALIEIKELKQKHQKLSKTIKNRKTSSFLFNIWFILYIIIVLPIFALIIFIKYTF